MTANLPYFHLRDGVYQYERRVPLRIQRDAATFEARFRSRPLFRRSLRTKRSDEAALAYRVAHQAFEALADVRQVPNKMPQPTTRVVTDTDLASIAQRYAAVTAEPFETACRRAGVDVVAAADFERMEYDLERDAEEIKAGIRSREVDPFSPVLQPVAEASMVIAEQGFYAPDGSEFRGAIIAAIRSGLEQGYRRITDLLEGKAVPSLGTAVAPLKPLCTLTLADAVDHLLADRQTPVKARLETQLALRQFEEATGRKALEAITRDDPVNFIVLLSEQRVGGKSKGSVCRPLSEHTIGKRLRLLSAAINHVRDRRLFLGENVFTGTKVANYVKAADAAIMPEKRRLQVSEINAILQHPWFTGCASSAHTYEAGAYRLNGSNFWVPIVALFTGCRAGELGGMKISEVRIDDPCPHLIVRNNEYHRTKNGRTRRVPIIDALMNLGFAEYVAGIKDKGHERLFPDWTARQRKGAGEGDYPAWSNGAIIRAFNRNVIPATLGDRLPDGARREVTFHSLRGAFKAMLAAGNGVAPIIVNAVVGHANDEMDERYIGEVTIEETFPAIRGVNYTGLLLPASPVLLG